MKHSYIIKLEKESQDDSDFKFYRLWDSDFHWIFFLVVAVIVSWIDACCAVTHEIKPLSNDSRLRLLFLGRSDCYDSVAKVLNKTVSVKNCACWVK